AAAHPQAVLRARLMLHADGRIETDAAAFNINHAPEPVATRLASAPLRQTQSELIRHKTTRRAHYEAFAPPDGLFDTLLWNEAGEITEFTRGNVAVRLGGRWLTPAASCGLLPGIGRAQALAAGRISEGVIRVEDLRHNEGIAFINSLRGWLTVRLECG
ncbi:MAG: aminotransferase class IV, partial [Azonexus sp.]|nr:aminotransferase class IV [Azonexus sp.]